MPLLRWPHDRHRGLCTRRGAQPQAINRHLMNSRLMPDQTDAPIAGPSPASPPLGPQTQNGVCRICSTHQSAPQTVAVSCQVAANTLVRQLPVSPAPHNHRAAPLAPGLNPHSARRTTCNLLPRLRALALLRRRPHTRPARTSNPASEKPAQERKSPEVRPLEWSRPAAEFWRLIGNVRIGLPSQLIS